MTPKCRFDSILNFLSNHNNYLKENIELTNLLITVSSLIYDLLIPLTILIWIIWDKSLHFFVAVIFLHGLRYICTYVHIMVPPENMIWRDPQLLPSISVSYDTPTLFFFNGHCALLALSLFYLLTFNNCIYIYIYIYYMYPIVIANI